MEHYEKKKPTEAFATGSIPKTVIKNAVPALIAMIMVMVYNFADVFFIGLGHDDLQVAAVSLASPVFMIFMSMGTLFGVGGTSVISRALGAGRTEYAKKASSFCMWACVSIGLLFMILLWAFVDKISIALGASLQTMKYAHDYLSITVACGVFSMISNCFSNVIRTEGEPMKAMTGTVIGNLVNLILDPIMILALGWGIRGAAIATVIGNVISALYYILYFLRGKSSLSISIRHFSVKDGILKGVIGIGLSASLANLLVSISSIVVNAQLAKYSDMYVAGYGITSKVMMVVTLIGIGIGSGVQPMIGYLYGAGNRGRLINTIKFSAAFSLGFCILVSAIGFIAVKPIVRIFLTDETAYTASMRFTRILLSTAWMIGAFSICQNALQAMGAATAALLASLFRQGIILIPAIFILQSVFGMHGLIWAQPVADVISQVIVIIMLVKKIRRTDFAALPDTDHPQG